jgi:subtilisin family serine protease
VHAGCHKVSKLPDFRSLSSERQLFPMGLEDDGIAYDSFKFRRNYPAGLDPSQWASKVEPAHSVGVTGDSLRRKLHDFGQHVVEASNAESIHRRGHSGQNVRVGVFDTGIHANHPHFRFLAARTDWTTEKQLDDGVGHGSFVAGVIASADAECPGFAPDAHIYAFRVFTNAKVSYTSWFLDAVRPRIACSCCR